MRTPKINFRMVMLFLAVVGPGIITANVDNDAGGITTYSVAGAQFGYKMLWIFIPMTIALIVVQEMSARMGAVTGKGLADLIRENYGVRMTLLIMVCLLLADLGNTISEFAGVAASMEIFGVSKYLSVPVAAFLIWVIVVKGTYKHVERVFLVASGLYFTYIISGAMAHPPWGTVARELVVPKFHFLRRLYSHGHRLDRHDYSALDAVLHSVRRGGKGHYRQAVQIFSDGRYIRLPDDRGPVALFIVVACAATIFVHGIHIETAKDAALALAPLAGKWASTLFAFGLLNASIGFSASILPLATAYYICEAFGVEAGLDRSWEDAPIFYWLYTLLIIIGAGIILIPNIPLIAVMLWSQVINGVLLPFILIYMLSLVNSKDLMGQYVNSRSF